MFLLLSFDELTKSKEVVVVMNKKEDFTRRVLIYTTLMVLRRMKEQLGLDGMCAFLESYTRMIDEISPEVKKAVMQELQTKGVDQFYMSNSRLISS